MGSVRLLGVDGCPAGWVVAERTVAEPADDTVHRAPLATPSYWIAPTFADLLARVAGTQALIGVDIPIGLPTGRPDDDGVRAADQAVRTFLGGRRRSSVFSAPCRRTLEAETYFEACAAEQQARGVRLSRQAFGILPKIREVDAVISPAYQGQPGETSGPILREAHPEAAFAMLSGGGAPGHGLVASKRSALGEAVRLDLLRPYVGVVDVGAVRRTLISGDGRHRRIVGRDDIVDALACLVVARRIAIHQAWTFPDGPSQTDARGLRMAILA